MIKISHDSTKFDLTQISGGILFDSSSRKVHNIHYILLESHVTKRVYCDFGYLFLYNCIKNVGQQMIPI